MFILVLILLESYINKTRINNQKWIGKVKRITCCLTDNSSRILSTFPSLEIAAKAHNPSPSNHTAPSAGDQKEVNILHNRKARLLFLRNLMRTH